jgi:hypothetical protein
MIGPTNFASRSHVSIPIWPRTRKQICTKRHLLERHLLQPHLSDWRPKRIPFQILRRHLRLDMPSLTPHPTTRIQPQGHLWVVQAMTALWRELLGSQTSRQASDLVLVAFCPSPTRAFYVKRIGTQRRAFYRVEFGLPTAFRPSNFPPFNVKYPLFSHTSLTQIFEANSSLWPLHVFSVH